MKKPPISRRRFLGLALAGGGLVTLSAGKLIEAGSAPRAENRPAARYAMVIDTTKCTGCAACIEACNQRNNLPAGKSYIHHLVQGDERLTWYMMVQCQHCANPPCAAACPTNATYIHESGVVLIDERLCVGCQYCVYACPYAARVIDEERGVADKCWLCLPWVLGGGTPACVEACIQGARLFGRTDDPDSEVMQLIASGRARPLHPEFGTDPAVLTYIIEDPAHTHNIEG